jgi:glutamate dehydrogenase
MAGGTGGDLSGGEIKKSQIQNVILNIDGPAVAYDPQGLNREELLRLVNEGKDLSHFDVKKLSKDGFKIIVNDIPQTHTINGKEITLTGREWQKQILGMVEADVFVPCGGARNTINRDNWRSLLLKEEGTPRVKVIFEGANVYIEEDVYAEIERAGIEVYRDLSANKGGVITSDFEINMGYIFDLQEFEKLMCFEDVTSYKNNKRVFDLLNIFEVKNKKEPVFRKTLIEKVLEIVYARSRQEYAAVGRLSENSKGQITGTEASEALANAINDTSAQILKNYKMLIKAHPDLEKLCVKWYLPDVVFTEKSIEEVMKRLPYEEKIKPIVATVLASQFHYKHGISQNSAYEMFGFINALASKKITLPTIKDILKAPIQTLING